MVEPTSLLLGLEGPGVFLGRVSSSAVLMIR